MLAGWLATGEMPSLALQDWTTTAQAALDEIEAAHRAVGGAQRGRRRAMLQVNHAYTVLLSAQFQAFCRVLHLEAVSFVAEASSDPWLRPLVKASMMRGVKLHHGNPSSANLSGDFSKFGMQLWVEAQKVDVHTEARRKVLGELIAWRNAVAHQDWAARSPTLHLADVRRWRRACAGLAVSFDRAVQGHLARIAGRAPW